MNTNFFKTLNGEIFKLDELTAEEKAIYDEIKYAYDTNTEWTEFTNLWIAKIREVFIGKDPSLIVEEPIYSICQDLDSRLGIRQGYTREPDYRDLLDDIISIHFGSRYRFCQEMGMDEGFLSSVLNRKKDLSLAKLQQILKKMNYRIMFIEKVEEPRKERVKVSQERQ